MVCLRDLGFFKLSEDTPLPVSWTAEGRPFGSAIVRRADLHGWPARARLTYTLPQERGEPRMMDYDAALASSQCHFGGHRYWFVCPLVRNGLLCGRRCRCLCRHPDGVYFGCRECIRLTYRSRRMHRDWIWECFLKYENRLKQARKCKRPCGIKASVRRLRILELIRRGLRGAGKEVGVATVMSAGWAGEEIHAIRSRLGWTGNEFAALLNVPKVTAISWENGTRKPNGAALRLLAVAKHHPEALQAA